MNTITLRRADLQAERALYHDMVAVYHGVVSLRLYKPGKERPWAPKRYLARLKTAERGGPGEVLAYATRLVMAAGDSEGLAMLRDAGYLDLSVEALVADRSKVYHRLFDPEVIKAARAKIRMVRKA